MSSWTGNLIAARQSMKHWEYYHFFQAPQPRPSQGLSKIRKPCICQTTTSSTSSLKGHTRVIVINISSSERVGIFLWSLCSAWVECKIMRLLDSSWMQETRIAVSWSGDLLKISSPTGMTYSCLKIVMIPCGGQRGSCCWITLLNCIKAGWCSLPLVLCLHSGAS